MRKTAIVILAIVSLFLTACSDDTSSVLGPDTAVPDDSTLISGTQPGETKRHADDWAGPLFDNAVTFGINSLLGTSGDATK
jgi:predicted small secreted protein